MDSFIDEDRAEKLKAKLDDVHQRTKVLSFVKVIQELRAEGEQLNIGELLFLQKQRMEYQFFELLPEPVARFFSLLLAGREATRLFNPDGGLGLLGAFVANEYRHLKVDVVTPLRESESLIGPLDLANLKLNILSSHEALRPPVEKYDAIFSMPSPAVGSEKRIYNDDEGEYVLNDHPSLLNIYDMAEHLSPSGLIAVLVDTGFVPDGGPTTVRSNLERIGLYISAVLSFPAGKFPQWGNGILDLVIITREEQRRLFVAEIPEAPAEQAALVARLCKRKQGGTVRLGRLVNANSFISLGGIESTERYDKLGKNKGLESVPFSSAVPTVRLLESVSTGEEHPHAVYLTNMGMQDASTKCIEIVEATSSARTKHDVMAERDKAVLQLLVDPKILLSDYLAVWLNTPLGHAFRQTVMAHLANSPRILPNLLTHAFLYLPSLANQKKVLGVGREIQRLRGDLEELEERLWEQPWDVDVVSDAVGNVNHEERLSDWIKTLPFPLASILHSYRTTDRSAKEKYERLLHFFEAFTEFSAAIHLSAIRSNPTRWEAQKKELLKLLKGQNLSLSKASFGSWRAITESMSANLRRMLADPVQSPEACTLYATADPSPLRKLASKRLIGVLQRVNNYRNRWSGHGGAVTEIESEERYQIIADELASLRAVIGLGFNQYHLIEAQDMEFDGAIYRCRIRRVMDSHPELEHDAVELTTAIKKGRLYLHNPGHTKALELVPLVQMIDMPQPASYFYNRIELAGPQMVSYHFASQSEMPSDNTHLLDFLQDFERNNSPGEDSGA